MIHQLANGRRNYSPHDREQSMPLAVGIALVAAAPVLLAIDLTLSGWARAELFPKWLVKATNLTEFFAHGFGVVVVALLIASLDPVRTHCLYAGLTSLSSGLAGDLAKLVLFRIRPRNFDFAGSVWSTFREWFPILHRDLTHLSSSLPSSHAATAAGLAFALMTLYPKGRLVFGILAVFACLQRVLSLAHFPSDVLLGAGLGWCVAWILTRFVFPRHWWENPN